MSAAEVDAARAQLAEAEARVEELKNGPLATDDPRRRGAPRSRARGSATTRCANATGCWISCPAAW